MKKSNIPSRPSISIVIPVEGKTKLLGETLRSYANQTYKKFEVLVASSRPFQSKYPFVRVLVNKRLRGDVSSKRNTILRHGRGTIFVFNDDDVVVPPAYLENIIAIFRRKSILAACGPLLTPKNDSFMSKASGAVWESYMGSVGAGIYRSRVMSARMVSDFPAANLILRSRLFRQIGGFEPGVFPGEDTKLLIDVLNKTGLGAYYHPDLFVYHHRKPLFKKHLQQIGRYGFQRGQFSLAYPTTSFKIQYFLPAFLVLYEVLVALYVVFASPVYNLAILTLALAPIAFYVLLLSIEMCYICYQKGPRIGAVATVGIAATHLYYGYKFIAGFSLRILRRVRFLLNTL